MSTFTSYVLLLLLDASVNAWDLSPLNLTDFSILHVSIYSNRAFLCIQSPAKDAPTLVEASWPENLIGVRPKIFAKDVSKKRDVCSRLLRAKATDIDRKGRLWIIDGGRGEECPPKLVVHNLVFFNDRILTYSFEEFSGMEVSTLILDPGLLDDEDTRAFILFHNQDFILMWSMRERRYAKLKFIFNQIMPKRPQSLSEAVITENDLLFLADTTSGNLFSLDLLPVRHTSLVHLRNGKRLTIKTPLNFVGRLLGPPKGLTFHPRGHIFYILPRDGAVVGWKSRLPLAAEYHDVVFQRSRNVTQLVIGWKNNLWGVSSSYVGGDTRRARHCFKINFR